MTLQARLADQILRSKGNTGLYDWAMEQRKRVRPPGWDEVAERLADATDHEISVGGQMLRRWLIALEDATEEK